MNKEDDETIYDFRKPGSAIELSEEGDKHEQIKFVSTIDSKPVRPPYLKLVSLKEFIKMSKTEKTSS